ncbi:Sulfite reductase [NADPH] flavoprotein alpha-component [Methylacidimicrobium cyclopophantes]|uniref:assimilatory sulfite reductase (NADPH) n=1 Tax=Methylacidimicrobium cyclopophantes TaxID=1041766 RepID=A0A5E6MGD0_9BACT|nr:sulfite reductase subunit alpha [Methylacidimicrobium cyclopophantes]VVM08072.1 Sulfite reductase [NADPH] flavoprotein alpha-component [Methylacidimicrobium cyclopophantes]
MTATPSSPTGSYTRANPFPARIAENRPLTLPGSEKETRHIVVDIRGSGLSYQVGDSLGIFARNPPELVEELLQVLGLSGEETISLQGQTSSLREALARQFVLNRTTKKFAKALAEKLAPGESRDHLQSLAQNEAELDAFLHGKDYVDLLRAYPGASFTPEELIGLLGRSLPRLYSVASAPALHPEEVHLTVAVVRFHTNGREKLGLASGYLARQRPSEPHELPVYIQPAKHFRLPEDPAASLILVGPGTGVAPFRAFLHQRAALGHTGRNWLFFGEQHRATDFFYEEEFLELHRRGVLTRFDTAFSRDQAHKIYVQHRMVENGEALWAWLQEGAHLYVCGDAHRMAKDVHQALIEIAHRFGGLDPEAAAHYVNVTLAKEQKRYHKDVY